MNELRWALLFLGVLFLAGLAVWEWRKPRRARGNGFDPEQTVQIIERPRRIEPSMDEFVEVAPRTEAELHLPAIHAVEPVRLEVSTESAVDVPRAARGVSYDRHEQTATVTREDLIETVVEAASESVPEATLYAAPEESLMSVAPVLASVATAAVVVQWPPERNDRVLSLRVVNGRGEALPGASLRFALEAAGLRHGPQSIFHRATAEGQVLASAANMIRPGNFDLHEMDSQEFRGVNLFCVLPGPLADETMLDELINLARHIARRLGAVVHDEIGRPLDAACVREMRDSLSVGSARMGDGADR
jgi:cell division protein ZipA